MRLKCSSLKHPNRRRTKRPIRLVVALNAAVGLVFAERVDLRRVGAHEGGRPGREAQVGKVVEVSDAVSHGGGPGGADEQKSGVGGGGSDEVGVATVVVRCLDSE